MLGCSGPVVVWQQAGPGTIKSCCYEIAVEWSTRASRSTKVLNPFGNREQAPLLILKCQMSTLGRSVEWVSKLCPRQVFSPERPSVRLALDVFPPKRSYSIVELKSQCPLRSMFFFSLEIIEVERKSDHLSPLSLASCR